MRPTSLICPTVQRPSFYDDAVCWPLIIWRGVPRLEGSGTETREQVEGKLGYLFLLTMHLKAGALHCQASTAKLPASLPPSNLLLPPKPKADRPSPDTRPESDPIDKREYAHFWCLAFREGAPWSGVGSVGSVAFFLTKFIFGVEYHA